ncbi:MAG: sulfotransferase domain-containing protein [Bdellovibrionales bacterium]|nr:sulfotransferase domain-containing protein [Bdellovibrionales bacterium]
MNLEDVLHDEDHLANLEAKTYIVSYPKSGRSWLRFLLTHYFCETYGVEYDPNKDIVDLSKELGSVDHMAFVHNGTAPEPYSKITLSAQEMKNSKEIFADKKVLFLVRDPRDVAISLYYHLTERKSIFTGSLEEFVFSEMYGLPKIVQFMNTWLEQKSVPKDFMLFRYEDMKINTAGEFAKMCDFLGLDKKWDQIHDSSEHSQFDKMKNMERSGALNISNRFGAGEKETENSFKVRQGLVFGFKSEMDQDLRLKCRDYINENLNVLFGYSGQI